MDAAKAKLISLVSSGNAPGTMVVEYQAALNEFIEAGGSESDPLCVIGTSVVSV